MAEAPKRFNYSLDIGAELNEDQQKLTDAEFQQTEEAEPSEKPKEEPDQLENEVQEIIERRQVPRPEGNSAWEKYRFPAFMIFLLIMAIFAARQPTELRAVDARAKEAVYSQLFNNIRDTVVRDWPYLSKDEQVKRINQQMITFRNHQETKETIENLAKKYKEFYQSAEGNVYPYQINPLLIARQVKEVLRETKETESANPRIVTILAGIVGKLSSTKSELAVLASTSYALTIGIAIILFMLLGIILMPESSLLTALMFIMHPATLATFGIGYLTGDSSKYALFLLFSCALIFWALSKRLIAIVVAVPVVLLWIVDGQSSAYLIFAAVITILASLVASFARNTTKKIRIAAIIGYLAAAGIAGFMLFKNAALTTIFPNALSEIRDLLPGTIGSLPSAAGGNIIAMLVIIAFACLAVSTWKRENISKGEFVSWTLLASGIGMFLQSRGNLIFAIPPLFIVMGYFFQRIYITYTRQVIIGRKAVRWTLFIVVLCSLVSLAFISERANANNLFPQMGRSIADAGLYIKSHSQNNAIVNTWWKQGYLVQYASERATPVDFGMPESSRVFWTALAFTTQDENLSAGIFRMLDCGGDAELEKTFGNTGDVIKAAMKILPVAYDKALKIAEDEGWPASLVEKTHCTPPEAFVMVTEGARDEFETMLDYSSIVAQLAEANTSYENTIVEGIITKVVPCRKDGFSISCNNGIEVNLSTGDARINNKHPKQLHIYRDGGRNIATYPDASLPYSAVLYETPSGFKSFTVVAPYDDSVLIRLFAGERFGAFAPVHFTGEPERAVVHSITWPSSEAKLAKDIANALSD